MIFFFLSRRSRPCSGNFLIPLMIGARDLAFPDLNLLSWYIYMIGGVDPLCDPDLRRESTPAGRSTRRSARLYLQHDGGAGGAGGIHRGLLLDSYRA